MPADEGPAPGPGAPTLAAYAARWLGVVAATRKGSTARRYEQVVRRYVVPGLGPRALGTVSRADCKAFLVGLLAAGHAVATVRAVLGVLQALFTAAAVDDDLVAVNPALGLGRRLGLGRSRKARTAGVQALTAEELQRFLTPAWALYPGLAPLFEVLARAGLRIGEGLALRLEDVRPGALEIRRQYVQGQLVPSPKSGYARTVEIGPRVEALLRARPPNAHGWLFGSPRTDRPLDPSFLGRRCQRIAAAAGLGPVHPHMLRHTYASLLLAAGEPPEWVSRQLGHAGLDLTIVTYGRWLVMRNPAGLAAFDALVDARPAERRGPLRLVPGGRLPQKTGEA